MTPPDPFDDEAPFVEPAFGLAASFALAFALAAVDLELDLALAFGFGFELEERLFGLDFVWAIVSTSDVRLGAPSEPGFPHFADS